MYKEILTQNGFTSKEAKVYLSVLEIGEATMSMIARKTKLARPTVYDIVYDLQKKGVLFINQKKGLKYVSALAPRILIDRFKHAFTKAESILPDLLELAYKSPLKPRIKFYEGIEGLKEILKEFSYSREDTYLFTDYKTMPPELNQYIHDEIIPERIKQKSFAHLVVPNNEINLKIQSLDKKTFREHRLVNFPMQNMNPLEILLFENKIAFLSYNKDEMFGLLIDSPSIYKTLKNIFLLIWNTID
ncbi:hypothetical protein GF354_06300 [Candidatus Peregrinibacteria bacterium]|nr:hypothetical protein [Candidatus Peregrinibacteria bacterium]